MISVTGLLLLALTSAHPTLPTPNGWIVPGEQYISENWRGVSDTRYMVSSGDFNGDGLADYVEILISPDGRNFGVFAFMARKDSTDFDVQTLIPVEDVKYLSFTGIEVVKPGSYATACGKGYWDCSEDEPAELVISNYAVNYFNYEGPNSFFYWDEDTGGFKSISISD